MSLNPTAPWKAQKAGFGLVADALHKPTGNSVPVLQ
jgi:hypothetical protein